MNFDDVQSVISLQRDNEGFVRDMRRQSKEAIDFVSKRDGQWETSIIQKFKGRPRYTDDRVNPIINQIVGEVFQADFTGRVRPAGGDATKDTAKVLDGLIRTIRNKSKFKRIINGTAKRVAVAGISGWEIVKDYSEPTSFEMDLMIQPLDDFHERVLIDSNSMSPVADDAKWAIIKHYISKDAFADKFGDDKKVVSLGSDEWSDSYYYKPDNITIGQLYYLKEVKLTIALMNDGSVYNFDDKFKAAQDELEDEGIEVVETREVDDFVCCQRWYSASEWLTEPEVLDFNFVPVVPCYGNFEVTEGKVVYYGAVERLMDIQRVHNYAFSRNVEEVALSPRSKWFMTPEQSAGYENKLRTLNTNMDPVQFYNHVADQPPPFYSNTSAANQSVSNLIAITDEGINKAAGIFSANIGDNPNVQSGVAIQEQIERGNNGTSWVFEALEQSIERTCELLIRAIPKTYDGTREVVLTQDDGSLENIVINKPVKDDETDTTIYLYDLTQGQYDVTVDVGAGYKNRQKEASQAFERLAASDPMLLELGRDIHLNNLEAPNMDKIAERARASMISQGIIPQEQMTEDEIAAMQQAQAEAANQPPPVDLNQMAMEIEQMKAQTAQMDQQNRASEAQFRMQELQIKFTGQQEKLQSDMAVQSAKVQQEQQKIDQTASKMQFDQQTEMAKIMAKNEIDAADLTLREQKITNDFGLRLTEMEQQYQTQLDAELKQNLIIFNPATGNFENA